jgi:glycine/D-amino acid oxidase-like deaminating enzyme
LATFPAVPALPLSEAYAEQVLWQTQVAKVDLPDAPLPTSADAVVIGGGYAGMSAAYELATRGHQVVVLEKDVIGWGASTRNGGMVIPELKAGPAALERELGPLGRRLYREVNEAFDHVETIVADERIDCSYARTGQLYLAHTQRHVADLKAMAREHGSELGEPVWFVPRDQLADEIGSTAYRAGLVLERTGGLQPAAFHRGLVERARGAGASLHQNVTARAVERRPGWTGRRVVTDHGAIDARTVLVLTNAYADGLLPELQRRVLPVGSFIIATEVLDPALARRVIPRNRMLVDTKNFLFYWRLTPDGRLAFGGRRSFAATTIAEARDFLAEQLLRVHPQLEGMAVEFAWGGNVAITLDRLPHVGQIDGAWYATGCNGSGVATNTWMGARLAQALCGDVALPAFAELPHPAIPAWRLRNVYLPLVGQWYRHQDTR